ncbi:MAG: DUF2188 domain-containing protein [Pseudohongiellaceae bacterium]
MRDTNTHHVIKSTSGGWGVKRGGASRASAIYQTKAEAISSARAISRRQGTRVVVHISNGKVQREYVNKNNKGHI